MKMMAVIIVGLPSKLERKVEPKVTVALVELMMTSP